MRYKLINITLLTLLLFCFLGCDDARLANITPPQILMPQSGEKEVFIYKIGDSYVYPLGVYKTGIEEVEAEVTVEVLSENELMVYNAENNTSYKRIPDNCFNIPGSNHSVLKFDKKSRLEYLDINIDYNQITQLEDYDYDNSSKYVIPMHISQSNLNINENMSYVFLNLKIRDPFIYFQNLESSIVVEATENSAYDQKLMVAVDFSNKWDITVSLGVDESLVALYNTKNNTSYSILSSDAYSISPNPLIINSGKKTASSIITFDQSKIDFDDYIVPIAIENVSEFDIDSSKYVHYVTVSKPAPRISREGWTIVDFSSEEKSGEGSTGKAVDVLDGALNTFWHSQWAGGTAELPHHLTIDMQKDVTVASVDIQRRQNNSDAQSGNIYISSDNVNFTKIGTFTLELINDAQTFKVTTTLGRYLKIEITESRRAPFASLSEVYVRGVE